MFKLFTTRKAFVYKTLSLFLLLTFVLGIGSYYVGLGSDPTGIVHFADHLSRGEFYSDFPVYEWFKEGGWGPEESHFVFQGNYVLSSGRMYCKYTIGFPLLLALSIRIFGLSSVYYANIFILLLLLYFYFLLARTFFAARPGGLLLALLCPILLMILVYRVWSLSLRPSRDLSGLLFIVAGVYLGMRALADRSRISWARLLPGAFCLGFSASIRLPNALIGLPAGLYLLASLTGKARWNKLLSVVLATALFFSLGLGPAFIQNYLATGNPIKPPRPEIVDRNPLKVEGETSPPPLWLGFFKTTAPDTAAYFWRLYGPLFAVLILIGLISRWKATETKFLMLGIPLVFILFYSMWVHLMIRYMLVAQPFLIILAVGGIGKLADMKKKWWLASAGLLLVAADTWFRWRWKYRFGMEDSNLFILIFAIALWISATWKLKRWAPDWRLAGLSLVALALFIGRYGPGWQESGRVFQYPEARRLGDDIDRLVDKGSVVFATKPVSNYITLFSGSYAIRPFEMRRMGVDTVAGVERMLNRGVKLYLIDSSGWKRDATKAVPGFRRYFDVTPVGSLLPGRYYLENKFGKPVSTIYRITPWSKRKIEIDLPVSDPEGDYLLMINIGRILDGREDPLLKLNGREIPHRFINDVNFIRIPAKFLQHPLSKLTIVSDRPLPSRVDFLFQPIGDDYTLDLAEELKFPDKNSGDGFAEPRLRDADLVRLGWETPGVVVIPTAFIPGTGLIGEIKVNNDRNFPGPIPLRISLNSHEIENLELPPGLGWRRIRFLLPAEYISSLRSDLELTAYPPDGHALSVGEHWSGSLLFEEISVRREKKEIELATPSGDYYYLSFTFRPSSPEEESPGSYRIMAGEKIIREDIAPGEETILLAPADISPPKTKLRVAGSRSGCGGLIDPDIIFRPLTGIFTIDLGADDDRAFIKNGFFDREEHSGTTTVRWTKGRSRVIIPVPGGERKSQIRFKIVTAGPVRRSGEKTAELLLDGRPIGSIPLEEEGGTYSFDLPGRASADPEGFYLAEVVLITPTWQPARYLGTADRRDLGVMVDRIEVEYK